MCCQVVQSQSSRRKVNMSSNNSWCREPSCHRDLCSLIIVIVFIVTSVSGSYHQFGNITNSYMQHLNPEHQSKKTDKGRLRETRFISFETRDNDIEIEMAFNIPFITVPLTKSGSTSNGNAALANINLGAIGLAGVMALGSIWVGSASKTFGNKFLSRSETKQAKIDPDQKQNYIQLALDVLDRTLQNYDVDTTACTQRLICWHVKNAALNVAEQSASTLDKVINGVTEATWAKEFMDGTAISDAINAGKHLKSCEHTFPTCRFDSHTLQGQMANNVMHIKTKP